MSNFFGASVLVPRKFNSIVEGSRGISKKTHDNVTKNPEIILTFVCCRQLRDSNLLVNKNPMTSLPSHTFI